MCCFKTTQSFTFVETYQKYLLKFSFINNFDTVWDHYACTWFGCHFEICSWAQQRCFFSHSVYNWKREREGWEKDLHQDWETKLSHRLKVRMHYCTVLKCLIPHASTVLSTLAQVRHAVLAVSSISMSWVCLKLNGKKSTELNHLNIDVSLSRFKHFCLSFDLRWLISTSRATCFLVWWWMKSWSQMSFLVLVCLVFW